MLTVDNGKWYDTNGTVAGAALLGIGMDVLEVTVDDVAGDDVCAVLLVDCALLVEEVCR